MLNFSSVINMYGGDRLSLVNLKPDLRGYWSLPTTYDIKISDASLLPDLHRQPRIVLPAHIGGLITISTRLPFH
jgi:hypothetical protein